MAKESGAAERERADAVPRVAFLPIAGPRNPYQRLQMAGLRRAGVDAVHGSPGRYFAATRTMLRRRPHFLHYDWNYSYFLRRPRWLSVVSAALFRLDLAIARRLGARIVLTLHNVKTHEQIHPDLQQRVQRWFARQCEWFRVADEATIAPAARYLDADPSRFRIARMGSYIGVYPDEVTRDEARRRLGIPSDAFVLLNLGELRPYKGLPGLIRTVGAIEDPSLRLVIAGRAALRGVADELRRLVSHDPRILLHTEFVPPNDVQLYARAADVMVLPFEHIDNSGSAILAMGFELPVVAPRIGALTSLFAGQQELLYDPGELPAALERVRALPLDRLREIGRINRRTIEGHRWEELATFFTEGPDGAAGAARAEENGAPRSLRRAAVAGAVRAMELTGVTAFISRRRGRAGGVVTYHNVVPTDWIAPGVPYTMDHGIDAFERQLDFFADRYSILPAAAAPDARDGIVLSFDDGMLNNLEIIAPILAERGLTALFAVVAGAAAQEFPHFWRDHLYLMLRERGDVDTVLPDDDYRLPVAAGERSAAALTDRVARWAAARAIRDPEALVRQIFERNGVPYNASGFRPLRFRPMNGDEVRALRRAGHVIASHTWSHPALAALDESARRRELGRSREWLEELLGEPVRWLVYPFGRPAEVDPATVASARWAGYEQAWMNIDTRSTDPLFRPRFSVPRSASAGEITATLSGLRSAWRHRRPPMAQAAL